MDYVTLFSFVAVFGSVFGFLVIRRKYKKQIEISRHKQEELTQKVYEAEVLREIGQRIGYALDAMQIIEIISASLERLLPYSAISYLLEGENHGEKIKFWCSVKEAVSPQFVKDVKGKMIAAYGEITGKGLTTADVTEGVSGGLIEQDAAGQLASYFNLPIVLSGRLVAIINISSDKPDLYNEENTQVLYRMAMQASDAVSKLHEVLENEKGRLQQAVESLSDGILMVDTKYKLVLVNRKLEEMLKLPQGPAFLDIVSSLSGHLDLRTMMEAVFAHKNELPAREIVFGDKVFEVVLERVLDSKSAKPMGIVVTFRDITADKSLEKLRSDFNAVMVHELRAPLTTIKSTVEFLQEEGLKTVKTEDLEHHLQVIESTSQAMLELVSNLLDVAKIEAGKFDVICSDEDVKEAVLERTDSFKALAEAKRIKLTVNIAKNLPLGNFDKIRMKQVLNNLLANAIKFTDAGEVTVKVVPEVVNGNLVDILISVEDSGIGIEPQQIEKLFSKFSQLTDGRAHAGLKSTGLGLFITRGIVEAMGGKIWVESAGVGLGSTFNFTVPLAKGEHVEHNDEDPHIIFSTKRVARA